MVDPLFMKAFAESFWKLLIILDPFLGLVVFIHLTKGMSAKDKAKQALIAAGVASGLLLFFLYLGIPLLDLLGISLASFRVAGGVLLLILGIQAVLGVEFAKKTKNRHAAAVIIGTPLLCGPGAITTTIVLSESYGKTPVLLAIVLAMIITWVMLYFAKKIEDIVTERGSEIISRVFGLILSAVAAEMIKKGIEVMIKGG